MSCIQSVSDVVSGCYETCENLVWEIRTGKSNQVVYYSLK